MRTLKHIASLLFLLFILAFLGLYFFADQRKPVYQGEVALPSIEGTVEVLFDNFGIPHIYAESQEDAFFAVGYLQAKERLFQMEMLRRLSAGRLAEILGEDMVATDRFFRTIGLAEKARETAERFEREQDQPYARLLNAYLRGINQFIDEGKFPVEFSILSIPPTHFTPFDAFATVGYMGFSFAAGFKTDPVITYIHTKFGDRYLADLGILPHPDYKSIPVHTLPDTSAIALLENLSATVARVQEKAPWPSFIGSNSWVVAPGKSKSGHVLFSNDTHMAHTLPATWFEMHVEAPGLSLYGNFLPGLPFPLIAHTRHHSVGLTMLENDDMDLYKETTSPDHPGHTLWNEEWVPMVTREETIQVKGKPNVQFQVFTTPNGILINDVIAPYQNDPLAPPVSLWWIYHRFPNRLLEANYLLTTAKNPGDAAYAASLIAAPGLNVMYGDKAGNIAWWATAKLPVRPAHVNPNLLLDGTSNKDHPVSYLDFTQNPHAVNPPWGYVYSANNQPDSAAGMLHPGYYLPGDRAQRITSLLDSLGQMDVAAMSQMITDDRSEEIVAQLEVLVPALAEAAEKSPLHRSAYDLLRSWQGTHGIQEIGPVIYNKLLYHIIKGAMADELGTTFFEVFLKQHAFKTTVPILLKNSQSAWWDHHLTPETETREMVIAAAFDTTLIELSAQLGEDPAGWRWGKVHTLELGHPLGIIKPLNLLFNVGPVAVPGSNEVINNLGFTLNGEGIYKVTYGPAMRIVLDFADVEQSESVIPSGQSGHFNSPHYQDQFTLYTQNKFRRQLMNRTEIEQSGKRLVLVPTP